ncbi:DNA methylase, partial [Micromonospora zamorensis]
MRTTTTGVRKRDHLYGDRERGNLAYAGWSRLLDGFASILSASYQLLRPGGIVVITSRPVRRQRDDLIDLPGELLAATQSAGLVPVARTAAMLA